MIFELKIKPMSVNSIFRGIRFKTKQYSYWREQGLLLLPKEKFEGQNLEVKIIFHLKYPKKCDV